MKTQSNLPPGTTNSMIEENAGYLRFEVVPAKRWQHPDGRTASIYGAVPYLGDKGQWEIVQHGWTVRDNHFNTVGMGRPAFKTESDAQQFADECTARYYG